MRFARGSAIGRFVSRLTDKLLRRSMVPLDFAGRPNAHAAWELARDRALINWNLKNLGAQMAQRCAAERAGAAAAAPLTLPLQSKPTRQADVDSGWFAYWCAELKIPVVYHRKTWEYCYLLQTLHDAGMLQAGRRGLGFACGREPIASYLAGKGVSVLATDLLPDQRKRTRWEESGQHAGGIEQIRHPHLVAKEDFDRQVQFRFVDMNDIPATLSGFDFCWSICALEHLGSIANGLRFIENSLAVVRGGGIAVHTTEYNLDNDGPTADNCATVLFQRRHFEAIADKLQSQGHLVAPLCFEAGTGPMDNFVDLPPYDWHPLYGRHHPLPPEPSPAHLKLSIGGFACTCFGITIRKRPG